MDGFDLTERLATAAEMAEMLGVSEDDVLEWLLAGQIPYVDGPEGAPRVLVREAHSVDGPIASGLMTYSMSSDPAFQAEVARRRRQRELDAMDWGEVDLKALVDALASRLDAVVGSVCRVEVEDAMIWLRDVRGHGAGIDVASAMSLPEGRSGADRIRSAAEAVLRQAQDELAELTTDPWPRHGSGQMPDPRTELIEDGTVIRWLYGALENPVLELAPLPITEFLTQSSR